MRRDVDPGTQAPGRCRERIAARDDSRRRSRAHAAAFALMCLVGMSTWAIATPPKLPPSPPAAPATPAPAANNYAITTPQLEDALRPLRHLPSDGRVELHASVATLPDPLETSMGRAFDMAVAAVISAYQARGYELDGFALSWKPRTSDASDTVAVSSDATHRNLPSLLLFRRDLWRERIEQGEGDPTRVRAQDAPDVAYDLVYLVGDSPGYGIQPRAFAVAARCALLFNNVRTTVAALSPDDSCDRTPAAGPKTLDVIGPSFSGSMQSLAVAIGRLGCANDGCEGRRDDIAVKLVSPSASVPSNDAIVHHGFVRHANVEYGSLAWTLQDQMLALTRYLCRNDLLPDRKIVFLVEESTFGRGAQELAAGLEQQLGQGGPDAGAIRANCLGPTPLSIQVRQFSPNISSIRAEHSRLRKAELAERDKTPGGSGRLLELDLTGVENGVERPPAYQPALTSRSDELMLYRMFDSLRVWGKPNAVVIVATDVRDRIFLLSEVRKALPWALPAMLEMDYLVVHPDYRSISRGAVVVSMRDPMVCVLGDRIVQCQSRGTKADEAARCGAPYGLRWVCRFIRDEEERRARRETRQKQTRFAFSTDQAANTFRAVHLSIGHRQQGVAASGRDIATYLREAVCPDDDCQPRLYVATLAGFASLDEERRSTMVAADARLALQRLWYLATALFAGFFFLVGVWLLRGAPGGSVMSNLARYVITDSRWLTRRLPGWLGARGSSSSASGSDLAQDPEAVSMLFPRRRTSLLAIAIMAGLVLLVAVLRLWQTGRWGGNDALLDPCLGDPSCPFDLAHGRDVLAVYCLWGLYACLAIVGVIRLNVAARRQAVYGRQLQWSGAGERARPWLIPVGILVVVVVTFYFSDSRPVSVDARSPWLLAMLALVCSVAFMVALGSHMRTLVRITLWLSKAIAPIQKRKDLSDWPSPRALQETMQTPFNLSLSRKDVATLKARPLSDWINTTRLIMDGNGVYPPFASTFDEWQRQLVAELKLLVVAIRFAAWCAMAAPLVVLLAMTAYPPVYERWLKTMSIGLLLLGFAFTIMVVLRLEKNPMLGPMFTRHGDDLSFGGALRALWPKFVAMAAVLIPLVVPDVWDGLHALVRSIDSLR